MGCHRSKFVTLKHVIILITFWSDEGSDASWLCCSNVGRLEKYVLSSPKTLPPSGKRLNIASLDANWWARKSWCKCSKTGLVDQMVVYREASLEEALVTIYVYLCRWFTPVLLVVMREDLQCKTSWSMDIWNRLSGCPSTSCFVSREHYELVHKQ
jgi:hypothetical protein